jgi:hypothetical protein
MRRFEGSLAGIGFSAPASAAHDDLDPVSRATGATGAKAEENVDQA